MKTISMSAAGMLLNRKKGDNIEAAMEPDADEKELALFEANCRLLNTKQYTGFRRVQGGRLWLCTSANWGLPHGSGGTCERVLPTVAARRNHPRQYGTIGLRY